MFAALPSNICKNSPPHLKNIETLSNVAPGNQQILTMY